MFRYACVTILVLLGAAAFPQSGTPVSIGNANLPNSQYKIQGTVVSAVTGHPIPRVLVELYLEGRRATLTGPEGEFVFDKLPEEGAMIIARRPGFLSKNTMVDVQAGKIVVKLAPECIISGTVVDSEGEPIENAGIEALVSRMSEGRKGIVQTHTPMRVRTDEDGNFRLAGLSPGKYYVSVTAGPAAQRLVGMQPQAATKTYPAVVFYPSASDVASATPVDLVAGQHARLQFTLPLLPAFKLSGTVSGIAGFKQLSNPMILDAAERPLFGAARWDTQSGAFEFPAVPAGTYTIQVYAMAEDDRPAWARQSVTVNRDITGVNLALVAGATIPVTVRKELGPTPQPSHCEGGFPTRDGKMLDCSKVAAMVSLVPVGLQMQFSAEPDSDDPASLAVRGVMPGKYRLDVSPMVVAYVSTARSGSTDLLREELIVPAGGTVPPIEVVLRDDGATMKVHVQADAPGPAVILLLPQSAPLQQPRVLGVGANGEREYGGLAPGEYAVLAFDSIEGVEYRNPDFVAAYLSKAARVTLAANTTTSVSVELIHREE
jgi:Carboxypeptidase regulatory-like domain